ncbi:MAG: hypothetical protein QOE04_5489, partial [Mycobacterium sp.]|nr:hypothetical protein [Mycobacterium sp.]
MTPRHGPMRLLTMTASFIPYSHLALI